MAIIDISWDAPTKRSDESTPVALRYTLGKRKGTDPYAQLAEGRVASAYADQVDDPPAGEEETYRYRVKATEAGYGDSEWAESNDVVLGDAANAPLKPTVTGVGTETTITATGHPNPAPASGIVSEWRFRYKLVADSNYGEWTPWNASSSTLFSSLTANMQYHIQAQARNSTDESPISDAVVVRTVAQPAPAAPTLELDATHDSVTATVGKGTGGGEPSSFRVEISTADLPVAGGGTAQATQTLTAAGGDAVFPGLRPNTRYYVRATAINATGSAATKKDATTDPQQRMNFVLPTELTVVVGSGTVHADITGVVPSRSTFAVAAGSGGHVTHRYDSSRKRITFTGVSAGAVTFTVTGTDPDGTYLQRARTIKVTAQTEVCTPDAPTVSASGRSTNCDEITATATPQGACDPTEYQFEIRRGTTGSTDRELTGFASSASHRFTSLRSDTVYTVRAQAKRGSNTSAWSDWRQVRTCDPCSNAGISIDADSTSISFQDLKLPGDIQLSIDADGPTIPQKPTASVSGDKLTAEIVTGDTETTWAVRLRSDGTVKSQITRTVSVNVRGAGPGAACPVNDHVDITVTVTPKPAPCDGLGSPGSPSATALAALVEGGVTRDFTASAKLGSGSDGMEIRAASSDENVLTVAKKGRVSTGGLEGGTTRHQEFTVTPVAEGDATIEVTFFTKIGNVVCTQSATLNISARVTYTDPCAQASASIDPGSIPTQTFQWLSTGAPNARPFGLTIAASGGAALEGAPKATVAGPGRAFIRAAVDTQIVGLTPGRTHRLVITPTGTPTADTTATVRVDVNATCVNRDGTQNRPDSIEVPIVIKRYRNPCERAAAPSAVNNGVPSSGTYKISDTAYGFDAIARLGGGSDGMEIGAVSSDDDVASVASDGAVRAGTFENTRERSFLLTVKKAGSATITITFTSKVGNDLCGARDLTATFTVTVPRAKPTLKSNPPSQTLAGGATHRTTLSDYFEDVDGPALAYQIVASSITREGSWNFRISNGILIVTAPAAASGAQALSFQVRASNSDGQVSGRFSYGVLGTGPPNPNL